MEAATALEPGLTAQDLRVLRAVPSGAGSPAASALVISESLAGPRAPLIEEIVDTLRGLEHLGYVTCAKGMYWRTAKGAQALA